MEKKIEVVDVELEELRHEYAAELHGMQTGVAIMMGYDGGTESGQTSPKHLRVGVNSALSGNGALVSLLIEKGFFTETEFMRKLVEGARAEREEYERRLSEIFGGKKVVLR